MLQTYALFDFDGTLIRGDSIIAFMRYVWKHKLCSLWDWVRFVVAGGLFTFGLISPKRAKEMALRFLKGHSREQYVHMAEDFCQTELIPRLYPQGMAALRRHQAASDQVLVISASPAFYLEPLVDMLGLTAVLGTRFETDEQGRFTGRIIGINCRGEEKPLRIQDYLDKTGGQLNADTSLAYGNSTHDLPMMRLCRRAYAVDPSRKLRSIAKQSEGITVVHWKETN